jgi:hypothetical protein
VKRLIAASVFISFICFLSCITPKPRQSQSKLPCGALLPCTTMSVFDSLPWFRREFAEFQNDTTFQHHLIYITSPFDDDVGSLLSCKWSYDSLTVSKGSGKDLVTRKLKLSSLDSISFIEMGDFCRFCNDDGGNLDLYFFAIKSKGKFSFRYQSVNSPIESEFVAGSFPKVKKVFQRLNEL